VVDKSDKRLFWLVGGYNRWIKQTNELFENDPDVEIDGPDLGAGFDEPTTMDFLCLSEPIRQWIKRFIEAGIIKPQFGTSNLVYVGDCIELLKEHGVEIKTKSTCRGNGQANGYLDVSSERIGLWSYADGCCIWSFVDVDAELVRFFGPV